MKSNWPTEELRQLALTAVATYGSDLKKIIPHDAGEYGWDGNSISHVEFYAEILGALCKYESNFKTHETFKEGFDDSEGQPVISRGLLQISIESANGYGAKLNQAMELHDPATNLRCGVLIMSRWISRDGFISGVKKNPTRYAGMARYWSPFRKPERVAAIKKAMKQVFEQPNGEENMGKEVKRNIEQFMVEYIDGKLAKNGLAQEAIKNKQSRILMVEAAKTLVGIKEDTGRNDGKFIKGIQETVGGASGEPYCIAGVMTCLAYVEKKIGVTSKLMATEHAQTLFKDTKKRLPKSMVKKIPLPGAVALWGDVGKNSGHGEIVYAADDKQFFCVGFNTSGTTKPGSEVNREGNGVFFTVRSYKDTAKRKLLGFVKPFETL